MTISYRIDPHPGDPEMFALFEAAWGDRPDRSFAKVLERSLVHLGAYDGERLVGFVNVASDGGVHAFLLDTTVHPDRQRQGIATELVRRATKTARERGVHWLHVDYESHLQDFYGGCGFRPTLAGLIRL